MGDSNYATTTPSSASTTAPAAVAAPKPKTDQSAVDVGADQILNPAEPELAHADEEVLDTAIATYISTTYETLKDALKDAVDALSEPPKRPEMSLAIKLIAELVDTLTEFALDYISGGLFEVAKHTLGHVAAEALHTTAEVAAFKGAKVVGDAVENTGEAEPPESADGDDDGTQMFNPAAKTLLAEFASRQQYALAVRRADATVLGAQIRSAVRKDRSRLTSFARNVQLLSKSPRLNHDFITQTTIGWLNFSALASVGKEHLDETEPSGFQPGGALRPHQWRDVSDGVIDIEIAIPETLWGTQGFRLRSMRVASGEGAARVLRNRAMPLLGTPVLRRIWLANGDSKLDSACAIVLYPSGASHANPKDRRLMSIGKLAPVDLADTSDQTLIPTASAKSRQQPNGVESAEQELAAMGASLLTSWLATLNTRSIR